MARPKTLRLVGHETDRRTLVLCGIASALVGCAYPSLLTSSNASNRAKLQTLELQANGRLGAYIFDTANGSGFGWRENERFNHASSFKMSLAAMILSNAENGFIDLNEILRWTVDDLMFVSPVTTVNVDKGLSVRDLARATLVTSDNTAANILLRRVGGPEQLTRFWRSLGDGFSRLDRYEPELNVTPPGTELDTTTPFAMAHSTAKLIQGDALTADSQSVLRGWMAEVRTGRDRIRAGFPSGWVSGDKTGTGIGDHIHTYVDIAFGSPIGRPPIIVAAYFEPAALAEPIDRRATAVLAKVGRIAAESI
ncbi:MAG: class A beta-lactamase [Blastomonas sp.]